MIDYSIQDVLGFTIPKQFIAEVSIEDDESSAEVEYEQIQTAEFAAALFWSQQNQLDEGMTPEFMTRCSQALEEYVKETHGKDETINTICENLYEYRSEVEAWLTKVNEEIEADAQTGFEDRVSGDYWKD
jgi:TRAP-type mannitol/chloroaromatic compound transport system substrate-binding protein